MHDFSHEAERLRSHSKSKFFRHSASRKAGPSQKACDVNEGPSVNDVMEARGDRDDAGSWSSDEDVIGCNEFDEPVSKHRGLNKEGSFNASNEAYIEDIKMAKHNRRVTRWQRGDRVLTPENLPVLKR